MLIKSLVLAAGFFAIALAGSAHAESTGQFTQVQQRRVPMRIQRFDANHDGVLTPNEIPPRLRAWFAEVDTNHDNIVTADEIRAYNRTHPHAHHHHDHGGQPQPQPQPQI